jgi:hypothetical protein
MSTKQRRLFEFPPHAIARFEREHAIIDTLERIEAARQTLHDAARALDKLIADDPFGEWPPLWAAFQQAGGVTARELCRFMVNKQPIRVVNKHHRHLRQLGGNQPTAPRQETP